MRFTTIAEAVTAWCGSMTATAISLIGIFIWLGVGHMFEFSDTWQLVGNSVMSAATFIMTLLIQHTSNNHSRMLEEKMEKLERIENLLRDTSAG